MKKIISEVINKVDKIKYGWIDDNKCAHTHSKKQFFLDNYKYMGIEDTIKYGMGTCFEKSLLIQHYLKEEGISSTVYIADYGVEDKIASHTFCVVESDNKFYLIEPDWIFSDENYEFNSLNDLLCKIIRMYPKMYKIEPFEKSLICINEVLNIEPGMSYFEFKNTCKNNKKIEVNML